MSELKNVLETPLLEAEVRLLCEERWTYIHELLSINAELLEACKYGLDILLAQPNADDMGLYQIQAAIAKAEIND